MRFVWCTSLERHACTAVVQYSWCCIIGRTIVGVFAIWRLKNRQIVKKLKNRKTGKQENREKKQKRAKRQALFFFQGIMRHTIVLLHYTTVGALLPGVCAEVDAEDALHAFGVVYLSRPPCAVREDPDGAVVRAAGKFLSGRGEGDVHHRGHVVLVDHHCLHHRV